MGYGLLDLLTQYLQVFAFLAQRALILQPWIAARAATQGKGDPKIKNPERVSLCTAGPSPGILLCEHNCVFRGGPFSETPLGFSPFNNLSTQGSRSRSNPGLNYCKPFGLINLCKLGTTVTAHSP